MPSEAQDDIGRFVVKLWLVVALLLGLAAFYFLRVLVLLTLLSVLLAIVWSYVARALMRVTGGRLPRVPAVVAAVLLTGGVFGLLGFLLYEPLNEQFQGFFTSFPEAVRNAWMRIQPVLRRFGLGEFDPAVLDLGQVSGNLVTQGLLVLGAGVQTIGAAVAVVFLAFFWALNPGYYRDGLMRLLPSHLQPWANRILDESYFTLKQWMKATGASMVTIALLTTVLLWFIGIPYALLFGIAAGLLELVPFLGPFLAFLGPGLIGLSMSPATALWVGAGWIFVQTAEGNLVVPYFLSKAAELPPALTIFVIFAMGELFGFLGVFVASPTLALIVAVVRAVYGFKNAPGPGAA